LFDERHPHPDLLPLREKETDFPLAPNPEGLEGLREPFESLRAKGKGEG
jgi:hypothetical protein